MSLCLIYTAHPQPTPLSGGLHFSTWPFNFKHFYSSILQSRTFPPCLPLSGSFFLSFTSSLSLATRTEITLALLDTVGGLGGEWQGRADPYLSELIHAPSSSYTTPFTLLFVFSQADQRFVWNGNLLRDFTAQPEVLLYSSQIITRLLRDN